MSECSSISQDIIRVKCANSGDERLRLFIEKLKLIHPDGNKLIHNNFSTIQSNSDANNTTIGKLLLTTNLNALL